MREVIEQLGSSVVTSIATVIIVVLLTGLTAFGAVGLVGIAGYGTSEITAEGVMQESASSKVFEENVKPKIVIKNTPQVNENILQKDMIGVDKTQDYEVEILGVTKNGVNSIESGIVETTVATIKFKEHGTYNLLVKIKSNSGIVTNNIDVYI